MFFRDTSQQDISHAIGFLMAVADGSKFCCLKAEGGWFSRDEYQCFKSTDHAAITHWLTEQYNQNRNVFVLLHKVRRFLDFVKPASHDFEGTKFLAYRFFERSPAEICEVFSPAPTVVLSAKSGNYAGYALARSWDMRRHAHVIKARAAYMKGDAESTDWLPLPFLGASMAIAWDPGNIHDTSAFPSIKESEPEHEREMALSMYAPVVRSAPVEQSRGAPQFDANKAYPVPPANRNAPSSQSVMLGNRDGGGQVHWAPFESEDRLLNFGVLVTGDPGAGKTETLKVIINGIARMGFPICVFDFKNDYSDKGFCQANKLKVHDVRRNGLPFNPLMPSAGEGGQVQPMEHIFTITGVFKRVFGLGDRQAATLRDAIREAFEARGIDPKKWVNAASIKAPCFDDVVAILEDKTDQQAAGLLDRISPLFDLGLFPRNCKSSFEAMIDSRVVLSLSELPSDEIKAALAELTIIRLHGVLLRRQQPRKLTRLIVVDEAWRIASSKHLENLAREGRAFGAGIAIGTQFPGDLPADFSGALDTKIFLKNQQPDHRRAVIKALCGGQAAPEAGNLQSTLERLKQFEGLIQNSQHQPFAKFKVVPYFARQDHGNVPDLHTGYDPEAMHIDADEDQSGDDDYRPIPARVRSREADSPAVERAKEFLREELRTGPKELAFLRSKAGEIGIYPTPLYAAKNKMHLRETGVEGSVNNGVIWGLPQN